MDYQDFIKRLAVLIKKNPGLMVMTLSNIFTMRQIGNKTHGDLAEIAVSEFINQYMYDYKSTHVGKDLFRSKNHEEDILVTNEITGVVLPVSLKAYGVGPLQLSTDKNSVMFPRLEQEGVEITDPLAIANIFNHFAFKGFQSINVLPLIYDEKKMQCNIMVFDYEKAIQNTMRIQKVSEGGRRKHPVYRFYDAEDNYICEVRYGGASANALQRGLWTNTRTASDYFFSVSGGWIEYTTNTTLLDLFSHALVASEKGHEYALIRIDEDITRIKSSEA
ncbi:hypothetical protein [Anaerotardibacter muris]|uniref:hypothetical protein n=1 Tax=Anaerotardibacter muris TaxID=2941505 RepID=UPI00203FC63F|nr:hypothetical protein [Anaerotardibacter muris]